MWEEWETWLAEWHASRGGDDIRNALGSKVWDAENHQYLYAGPDAGVSTGGAVYYKSDDLTRVKTTQLDAYRPNPKVSMQYDDPGRLRAAYADRMSGPGLDSSQQR